MVVAGWLIARIGAPRTFATGMAVFAAIYVAYFAAPSLPILFAVQALRGFGFAAYTATSLTMAIELAPPTARGRASGLYQSAQGLAQILGNWVGPPLAGVAGYPLVFGIAAVESRLDNQLGIRGQSVFGDNVFFDRMFVNGRRRRVGWEATWTFFL